MFEAAIPGAFPAQFETEAESMKYIEGQPTCPNEVRPWVRNMNRVAGEKEFLVIGGRPTRGRGAVR
jgi:CRISPR/Cas system CMR subunit Cmr4 (Cas7 group RAMP superfamily)